MSGDWAADTGDVNADLDPVDTDMGGDMGGDMVDSDMGGDLHTGGDSYDPLPPAEPSPEPTGPVPAETPTEAPPAPEPPVQPEVPPGEKPTSHPPLPGDPGREREGSIGPEREPLWNPGRGPEG